MLEYKKATGCGSDAGQVAVVEGSPVNKAKGHVAHAYLECEVAERVWYRNAEAVRVTCTFVRAERLRARLLVPVTMMNPSPNATKTFLPQRRLAAILGLVRAHSCRGSGPGLRS